jgi:hypothetical protein
MRELSWKRIPPFIKDGAGYFAKPAEYRQIIAILLNQGLHPCSGVRILKKEVVGQMLTNQVCGFGWSTVL